MAGISTLAKMVAMKHAGKALPKAVHTRKSIPSGSAIVKSKKEAAPRQTGSERLEEEILKSEGAWVEDDYIPIDQMDEDEYIAKFGIGESPKKYTPFGPPKVEGKLSELIKKIEKYEGPMRKKPLSRKEKLEKEVLRLADIEDHAKKSNRSFIQELEVRENAAPLLNPSNPSIFDEQVKSIFNARDPKVYISNTPSELLAKRNYRAKNFKGLRLNTQKRLEENLSKKEAKRIIGESDGLPTILFHSTTSKEAFPTFELKKIKESGKKEGHYGHDFLSTSTDPTVIRIFGLQRWLNDLKPEDHAKYSKLMDKKWKTLTKDEKKWFMDISDLEERSRGARTIVGVGKVKKLFDYNKNEDRDVLLKYLEEKNPVWDVRNSKTKKYNDLSLANKISFKTNLKNGSWRFMETPSVKEAVQELGYDAFTTTERGGKNVMLFNPKEQFIPIFDPKMQSTVGFNMGGSIKTNPYLRGLV